MTRQAGRHEAWVEFVQSSAASLASALVSHAAFESAFREAVHHPDSPVLAAQLTLRCEPPGDWFQAWSVGAEGSGPSVTQEEWLDEHHLCSLKLWRHKRHATDDETGIRSLLMGLLRNFWKRPIRDHKSRLQSVLIGQGDRILEQTLARYWERNENVFFFFCDLDHFKRLNDASIA